jgi:hypothetical protein
MDAATAEDYIRTYGPYANKLLRLHLDLIQALDRHRRGHKQTVEVHHLHLHSGAQGMVGIVNAGEREGSADKMTDDPIRQADIARLLANMATASRHVEKPLRQTSTPLASAMREKTVSSSASDNGPTGLSSSA